MDMDSKIMVQTEYFYSIIHLVNGMSLWHSNQVIKFMYNSKREVKKS